MLALGACSPEAEPPIVVDFDRDGGPLVELDYDAATPPTCEETCAPLGACDEAFCEDGECVHRPRPDGFVCAEDASRVCVAEECVVRECGDGWREPGEPDYPREQCDPGPGSPFCTESCEARVGVLAEGLTLTDSDDLAVGMDPEGRALVLVVERFFDEAVVTALRFDRRLEPAGTIEIARMPRRWASVAPAVAGLDGGGWAIALEREPDGLVIGVVGPEADSAPALVPFSTSADLSVDAAVAALRSGFVVVAMDLGGEATDPLGGVRARLFDPTGRPRGAAFGVPSDTHAFEMEPTVAAFGDTWLAAWTQQDPLDGSSRVRMRAFEGRSPLDVERGLSTDGRAAWAVNASALSAPALALTWLESDGETMYVRAQANAGEGTHEPETVLESERFVTAPAIVPLAPSEFAVTCIEDVRHPVLRAVRAEADELNALSEGSAGTPPRWARGPAGALAVWGEPETGRLFAFRIAPR